MNTLKNNAALVVLVVLIAIWWWNRNRDRLSEPAPSDIQPGDPCYGSVRWVEGSMCDMLHPNNPRLVRPTYAPATGAGSKTTWTSGR